MNNIRTGDQSGGLKPEHGGSTPVKTGGVDSVDDDSQTSKETAVSTDGMNAPNAFAQRPETNTDPRSDDEASGDSPAGQSVAQY